MPRKLAARGHDTPAAKMRHTAPEHAARLSLKPSRNPIRNLGHFAHQPKKVR